MPEDCIFCRIVAGEISCSKVYQNDQILAFLDINPVSQGHCLVMPKQHFNRFDQCPAELAAELARHMGKIARAVVSAVEAEGYNILNNNGRCSGQLVEHLHFHIIPRRTGDGVFDRWPAGEYPAGFMEKLALKIKNLIKSS
ncbi:MAG: hypothetical protein AMJ79_13600 [Phycisphaerae bacterium SM23_30]|nr:MAG: hypothetical protein AMJ79_13600 [Phycisphaerae bacterium SM23_30]